MLELPPDVETRLREKAARHGKDIGNLILDQNPALSSQANSLKPEDYPREGEDWTEEDLQIDLDWAMHQRQST